MGELIYRAQILPEGSSLQVDNMYVCLFVCLFVCHHFEILNMGPLYPRNTSDHTYFILSARGGCQVSSGDVNDTNPLPPQKNKKTGPESRLDQSLDWTRV